ncbi:MAG: DUF1592 domain-containing protein [Polyangiales bacterium]
MAVALILPLLGCDGQIGNLSGSNGPPRSETGSRSGSLKCDVTDTGFQPLRRLSSQQIDNTLRTLFGNELGNAVVSLANVPDTKVVAGFSTEADANVVNSTTSAAFEDAAESIAAYLVDNASTALPKLMPCASGADISSCIDRFIDEFGLKAYRRPLTSDERQILRDVYDTVSATQTAEEAWAAVVQVVVQSPQFLYLVEQGGEPVGGGDYLVAVADYEMASRLSYFLNNTMPDDELFEAAAAGELRTPEQIEAQARRLVAKDELIDVLASFHNEWLGLYDFSSIAKSPELFPNFNESMRAAMASEIRRLTEHVMYELDGTVPAFLSASDWEIPAELAPAYGLAGQGFASDGNGSRAGALTSSAFLATHAHPDSSSVIRRGVFIRRAVLCGNLAPPQVTDDQREAVLAPAAEAKTARDRLEPLTQNASCASCHNSINPVGLALENFDAIGQWRDTENDAPIDASGSIEEAGDANGSFEDPMGFVDLISESTTVKQCYSEKLLRFALGRLATDEDGCALDELKFVAQESNGDIRELLVGMTLTDSFRFRRSLP